MIRSMTGFGAADGPVGSVRVSVELRSVNHRFFNPSLKLPGEFARWEGDVRESLRKRIGRGHVTVSARIDRAATGGVAVDDRKFASWVAVLRELRDRHGLAGDVDLATVLRMPDALGGDESVPSDGAGAALVALVDRAADALNASRAAEGARLVAFLEDRLRVIEEAVDRISARAPERLVAQRDRLRASVKQLAEGIAVDEQRLAQEIALLADRMDVQEELDRFRTHIAAFRESLRQTSEPVGKRLGFLLQEMLRETNTTGSKASDSAISREVLTIKEELERLREQVENLE